MKLYNESYHAQMVPSLSVVVSNQITTQIGA